MFAEATKKAAGARFKKPEVDSEGQEIEVSVLWLFRMRLIGYIKLSNDCCY